MAWHSAGTYRTGDGRGGGGRGQQRFAPLNSWPDNVNLDKARRLLWPIKQKYGRKISWADLMILAGNVALESMGFKTFGFGGGREDVWEPDQDVYWGAEKHLARRQALHRRPRPREPARRRADGPDLRQPGRPERQPGSARRGPRHPRDLRAHGDERRGDRRADRRRPHLRQDPRRRRRDATSGPSPEAAGIEEQGLGWKSSFGTGKGGDAITSGLEVTWTTTPTKWSNDFFENLFGYEWELTKSPAGAHQWTPKDGAGAGTVPDAHDPSKRHAPTMLTTDLSLRFDPAYEKISRRFHENPDQFADAFARAWFKLTHRDMGPRARYLGPEVPAEELIWQDPIPAVDHPLIDAQDIAALKAQDPRLGPVGLAAGLDRLGVGVDLPRLRQARRRQRRAHPPRAAEGLGGQPARRSWRRCSRRSRASRATFNGAQSGGKKVSLADLIVLGGCAAVEQAAKNAGHDVTVPFTPGRMDASQEQTDVDVLRRARADRGRLPQLPARPRYAVSAEELLVDRAQLLTLTAPEMTVLVGGLRVLNANVGQSKHGVFTKRPGGADQRLLREPARHGHGVEGGLGRRGRVRRARPRRPAS